MRRVRASMLAYFPPVGAPKPSDLMRGMTRSRPLRYLFVGGINTVFGYGVFAGCLALGLHYAVASAISTVAGVLFNFISTGTFVFASRSPHQLPRFIGVYVIIYLLNVSFLALLSRLGVSPYVGGLLLVLPVAAVGYLLNSRLVFVSND